MKNLRRNFERFCYRHHNKGIPNLMLYIVLATAAVYVLTMIDPSKMLYSLLYFDRAAILQGQVWRLLTYIILPEGGNILVTAISLFFYYYIGKTMEQSWGTFRFNLFYFSGVVIMDIAALLLGVNASIGSLNLSLLLSFATMFPENRVLLFYIIPIKMKYLAWFYFAVLIYNCFAFPIVYALYMISALLNYFLFFGSDILRVLPDFLQPKRGSKPFGSFTTKQKPNPNWANQYQTKAKAQPAYRHKCTVCGKTDVSHPDLDFRYCSRCSGYHCYCMEHINDHAHIQ